MMVKLLIPFIILNVGIAQANDGNEDRWQEVNHVIHDTTLGLSWQDTQAVSWRKKTWENAQRYCQRLKLDGKRHWRLPSLNELLTIVDYSQHTPAIVPQFNYSHKTGYYWTASTVSTDNRYAWYITFEHGNTYAYSKEEAVYVRCVHDAS